MKRCFGTASYFLPVKPDLHLKSLKIRAIIKGKRNVSAAYFQTGDGILANILDYLDWRGDVPFSADPFNEIDGLILSQLCYVNLDGAVSDSFDEEVSIPDAFRRPH